MRNDPIKSGLRRAASSALRAGGLATWLCAAVLATSCDSTEHVLLLDIHAAQPVTEIQVFLSSLGRPQPRFMNAPITVPMADRDLSTSPARIAIEVGGPEPLIAHIVGTLSDGQKVIGTRCYDLSVESVIEDDVILVGPLGSLDLDGDTFAGDPSGVCQELADEGGFRACTEADSYLCDDTLIGDCNDSDEAIFPGATVQCQDGVDDDCDGDIDEACGDNDGDGWDGCAPGMMDNCDCNDGDDTISPASPEVCGDTIDQDCDGEDEFCDQDGDGFRSNIDCDDMNELVFPGASETPGGVCDGIDNNCNESIDEVPECIPADLDGDGVDACDPGTTDTSACDCNDCDQGVFGGGGSRELCTNSDGMGGGNSVDDDCDGMVDEGCVPEDMDGDGRVPPTDCEDDDALTYPQTGSEWLERCGDGVDQNCVPGAEAGRCADDADGDGWAEPEACEGNADINPDTDEVVCDGIDNNCDGSTDEILVTNSPFGCVRTVDMDGVEGAERVEFNEDFQNCGGCRVLCDAQTADRCVDTDMDGFGVCDCSDEDGDAACSAGTTPTCCPGDGCVDVDNDVNNCGACGRTCGAGETCSGGECRCGSITGGAFGMDDGEPTACPDPIARDVIECCSGACVDIREPDNCGGCGFQCGPNSVCDEAGGFCRCDPGNFADCNGDLRTDPANDGCEVNTFTDVSNCGGCGSNCAPNNSVGTCNAGSCEIASCNSPFDDCDTSAFNGCEINTNTNINHCGMCGDACDLSRVNAHTCAGGTCGIGSCDNLYGDCDTTDANGCEVNLRNDTGNCGGCNVSCGARENCNSGGACTCSGQGGNGGVGGGPRCTGTGVECCPGAGCEDLRNTEAHCGACDTACGAMETCTGRRCTCNSAQGSVGGGEVCTGGSPDCCPAVGCVDTDDDMSNCGGCGNVCDTNRADACSGGDCRCDGGPQCSGSNVCCSDGCQNTMGTDEDNCGGCGVSCGGTCLGGACCAPGTGCASGSTCVTTSTDNACGNNGLACVNCAGMGQICVSDGCQVCDPSNDRGCSPGQDCNASGNSCDNILCGANQRVVSNACVACPAGSTNAAGDNAAGPNTSCDDTICGADQRVQNNACVACPAGSTNAPGDNATGGNTSCDDTICGANQRVQSNACVACPAGSTNAPGDNATGGNTFCDDTICGANQRVQSNACVACPAGSTNAPGDNATGSNTSCDPTICGENERVESNACIACPALSTNAMGDDATGGDTTCECDEDTSVMANECVACTSGNNNQGDPVPGDNTMCDD